MDLIKESFQRLFPDKELKYQVLLNYNLRLGDFNANIRLSNNVLQVNLNLKWKNIDDEIKIGLIQTLLLRMFAKRYHYPKHKNSPNIDFYNNFIKKIPLLTPKTKTHYLLEESFHRVNKHFFHELLDQPNLVWGSNSKRKLASYNFHSDTITVSSIFKETATEILDYLIYHELLHKKQKFKYKNGRNYFHTRKFRKDEARYPRFKEIEKEIESIIREKKTMFVRKSSRNSLWERFTKW